MAIWVCLELLCSILSILIYYWPESDIQVKSNGHLNFPSASIYNFERLDMLCTRIGYSSEKLWPFEFLESFRCLILSVLKYHGPQSYTRVKSYGNLNLPRAFLISSVMIYYWPESDIWVQSYGRLNLPCVSMFNFEHLGILCA